MHLSERRVFLALTLIAGSSAACSQGTKMFAPKGTSDPSERFKDLGMELVVDAMAGHEILGLEMFPDGLDRTFYRSSVTKLENRSHMLLSQRVPQRVRIVWHDSAKIVGRKDNPNINTYAGSVLGDHNIPVGERIPAEVTDSIRKEGGQLRIKFRLAKDGVYFGWDVDRRAKLGEPDNPEGPPQRYWLSGGDFREAYIFNGKVVRKGWYIDKKTGQKIETDF
jgi:hypothetical protein